MPRKVSPRTEPQSTPRRAPAAEAAPESSGQSGYGAGDGQLEGSGAWSGRANPTTESEDEREDRRIRATTPSTSVPQTPTSGEGESGTGDYGEAIGAGKHRGFGAERPKRAKKSSARPKRR